MHALMFDGEKTNCASAPFRSPLGVRVYTASIAGSGTVAATVTFQGSDDGARWLDLGSVSLDGTDSATGSTEVTNTKALTRAVISEIRGTSAAVTAQVEARSIPAGVVVGTTDEQTLTNKTLTAPVVSTLKIKDSDGTHNITVVMPNEAADRNLTIPSMGGNETVVLAAAAQTLTNKTLTAPALTSPTISGTPVGMLTYDPGAVAINNLRVALDVVSAETVTIGVDVYEVEIVNTDSTDNTAAANSFANTTNPLTLATFTTSYPATTMAVGGLLRLENEIMLCTASSGGSRTFSRGQFGTTTASHADTSVDLYVGDGVTAGRIPVALVTTLTPTAFVASFVAAVNAHGTEAITAVSISNNEVLLKADAVGAVVTACAETLGGVNNGFRAAAMAGGRAQGLSKLVVQKRVPTAVEIALDHMHFQYDFTPTLVQVFVVVTATPGVAKAWDGVVTIASGLVTIDNAGATDWAASDTLIVIAQA